VDDVDDVGPGWERVLSSDRPAVLEAVTDPDVPPLPPHVRFEQAKYLMFSLAKGDPDAADVIKRGFLGKLEEFLPHRGN
jgi:pyruvate dehydrogenase (quinone)